MFDFSYRGLFRLFFEMLKHDLTNPPHRTVPELCGMLRVQGVPEELLTPILDWNTERAERLTEPPP